MESYNRRVFLKTLSQEQPAPWMNEQEEVVSEEDCEAGASASFCMTGALPLVLLDEEGQLRSSRAQKSLRTGL